MLENYSDVIIVGAGLSGIGVACHLKRNCPSKSITILESRESIGGTWDFFRYPGIRSDSDMFTLGYNFKPWVKGKDIAEAASILDYIHEAAEEYKIKESIQFAHHTRSISWSSQKSLWTVESVCKGEIVKFYCKMLMTCTGYYDYEKGYSPDFKGNNDFVGKIVHPQHWPEKLDYSDKNMVVIGSGATAITLIPALAVKAKHVTMLQRSPSYIATMPSQSTVGVLLRKLLPASIAYKLTRWIFIQRSYYFFKLARTFPKIVAKILIGDVKKALGEDYDVKKHFTPKYTPWDQRLCLDPDGKFLEVINSHKASVVTDTITSFTKDGIKLASGNEIKTDIIVTATGLNLKPMSNIEVIVDDKKIDMSQTYSYYGVMGTEVPNLVSTFGYINISWTLRADLIANFFCKLINHMDANKFSKCIAQLRDSDKTMQPKDFIENFSAGYIQRSMDRLPKQGDRNPWINSQDYKKELEVLGEPNFEDGVLVFNS